MTLEELLRMEVESVSCVTGKKVRVVPDFRVAVQRKTDEGVVFIVHASGHNSETLDFFVSGNELTRL